MRATVIAVVCATAAVGLAAPASASTSTRPYRLAPTQACLIRSGVQAVRNLTRFYPEEAASLEWHAAGRSIFVAFAANPATAARLQLTFRHLARAFGVSAAKTRRVIVRRGNVVYYPNTFNGLTRARAAKIVHCLR